MFKTIFDRVLNAAGVISGVLIVLVMIEISTDVVLRYLFNRPIPWTIEFTQYSMIFMLYLGTARVLRDKGHVAVDILIVKLGGRSRDLMNGVMSIVGAIVCFIVTWYAMMVNIDYYQTGYSYGDVVSMPAFLLQGVVPLGTLLLTIQFLRQAYELLHKKTHKPQTTEVGG